MRRALVLMALACWPACRPRQSLALHFLTPAAPAGSSDDPFAAVDTLEVRPEAAAGATASAATSAPFAEGGHGSIDVAELLGDTPQILELVGIGNHSVLSLGRTFPVRAGATKASVYVGLVNTFEPTPMPRTGGLGRFGFTATPFSAGDAVLLAGGATERPASTSGLPQLPRADAIVGALEVYDAASGSFTSVGGDLDTRIYHAAVAVPGDGGDSILLIGGYGTSSEGTIGPLDDVVRVTRDAGGIRVEHDGNLPVKLWGHTATLLPNGGGILIVGGYTDAGGSALAPSAYLYSPGSGDSTAITLAARRAFAVATDLHDAAGEVLITGGADAAGPLDDALIYQPANRAFAAPAGGSGLYRGTMLDKRVGHSATLLRDGHVLVVGGNNGTMTIGAPEVFDPVRPGFLAVDVSQSAAAPAPRQSHQAVALEDGSLLLFGGEAALGATLQLVTPVARLAPAGGAPSIGDGGRPFPVTIDASMQSLPHPSALGAGVALGDRSILYVAGAGASPLPDDGAELFVPCSGGCLNP